MAFFVAVAVGLVTAGVYLRAVRYELVEWDDQVLVVENPGLNPPTMQSVGRFWTEPYRHLYTPLSYTFWAALIRVAGGPDPRVLHGANVGLHVLNVLLVFAILHRLLSPAAPDSQGDWRPAIAAAAGALVFALHPLQVEPVAWVSGMNNLLAGLFSLCAIWLFVVFAQLPPGRRRWWVYALGALALVCAMLAKPTAVVVPLLAGVLDWLIVGRGWRPALLSAAGWLALTVPFVLAAPAAQPVDFSVPMALRPLIALDSAAFYLAKLVWPAGLVADHCRTPEAVIDNGDLRWTWIAPATLAVIAFVVRRRAAWLTAALAVMAIGLLPVSGLVPFVHQRISGVASRYMYLPMLGVALAAAAILARWPRPSLWAVAAAMLVCLAVVTNRQIGYWRDTEALFRRNVAVYPQSAVMNRLLGYRAHLRGDLREAEAFYRAALRAAPDWQTEANLAALLKREGRFPEAIERYRAALADNAREPALWVSLGVSFGEVGKTAEAAECFQRALRLNPAYEPAQRELARLQARPASQ